MVNTAHNLWLVAHGRFKENVEKELEWTFRCFERGLWWLSKENPVMSLEECFKEALDNFKGAESCNGYVDTSDESTSG